MLRCFIPLLFFFICLSSKAITLVDSIPKQDSTEIKKDSIIVGYFNLHNFNPIQQKYKVFNNAIYNLHEYSTYRFGGYNNLLTLQPFYSKIATKGFYNKTDLTDVFYFNQDSTKYFKTRVPYADLLLVVGSQREQFFRFSYSQNINKALNFSANMARLTSEGHFLNQKMSVTDFNTTFNYNSTAHRYGFLLNASYRDIKSVENGGIQNAEDSAFKAGTNRQALLINMMNAKSKRDNRSLYTQQFIKLGRKEVIHINDTTEKAVIHGVSYLSYSFNIDQDWFIFNEASPSLLNYKRIFRNLKQTTDSTGQLKIIHEIAWTLPAGRSTGIVKPIGLALGLNKEYIKYAQFSYDSTGTAKNEMNGKPYNSGFQNKVDNLLIKGELSGIHLNPIAIDWAAIGRYYISGFQSGDYHTRLQINKVISPIAGKVEAYYELNKTTPAFVYYQYSANNFKWEEQLSKIEEESMGINYFNNLFRFSIGFAAVKLSNFIYLDTGIDSLLTPKQSFMPITVNTLTVGKDFRFWKFGFNNKFYYQSISDTSIMHLPKIIAQSSLYFASKVFNGVAELQTGLSVVYTSAYYANAYSPALGMYYLQHSQLVGNYPYIDFFFNVKIQSLRFFFKVEHANAGLMGTNYYLMPNYPAFDRVIKLGISWKFFD